MSDQQLVVEDTRTAVEKFDAKYYEINLLKAEINRQVGEIMAEVAGLVYEVEHGPLAEDVKAMEAELAKMRPAMEAEVIAAGRTVRAEHVQLVYTPPGYKWDTGMLDGMLALIPQIGAARKPKDAVVSVKGVK